MTKPPTLSIMAELCHDGAWRKPVAANQRYVCAICGAMTALGASRASFGNSCMYHAQLVTVSDVSVSGTGETQK